MTTQHGGGLARASLTLPSALAFWKLGRRLMAGAGHHSAARRWARVGVAGAALAGVAAILIALTRSVSAEEARQARLRDRLEKELEDSFPASDPPALTRSGGELSVVR